MNRDSIHGLSADRRVERGPGIRLGRFACWGLRPLPLALLLVLGFAVVAGGCSDNALSKAREAEYAGDIQTAAELYRQHLAEEPDDLEAIKGLAVALYMLGDFDGALPLQEKAVALDPRDSQIRLELGFNYLNHQERPDQAAGVFAEAAALGPTPKVLTFLAQAQVAAGRSAEAEMSLRRAITLDASYGHAYTILMGIVEDQGRSEEAAALRRAALEAGVDLDAAK